MVTQSVVQAVTVWMVPLPAGIYSAALYLHVTDVDSLGMPLVSEVFRNGPEIDLESSDGVNPPRCTFVLNPPLALSKNKRYFFAVREATCFAGLYLVAYRNDPYPLGSAWNVGQSFFCDGLGGLKGQINSGWDLRMTLTYCPETVSTIRRTWGRLKASYR